ncbi:MAG: hypothetical protein P8Q41_15725 [Saprospiraceae bacterium]|nr:hypothetical protein [Saprospiraceae bacterium]
MRIHVGKIAGKEIEILDYLSDDIFTFKIKKLDLKAKEESWDSYQKRINQDFNNPTKSLENEIHFKKYDKIGTQDELIKINLNHVFDSEFYITNGQKIISVLKNDDSYILGLHDYNFFTGYLIPHISMNKFSLESFRFKSCEIMEQIESFATGILSHISIQRIPIENNFIEIKNAFKKYFVQYQKDFFIIDPSYPNKSIDTQFEKLLIESGLKQAKCCINCKNFKSITAGHLTNSKFNGKCDIIKEKLPDLKYPITFMWNWCQSFERIK